MVDKNDAPRGRNYPYEDLRKSIDRARVIYTNLVRRPTSTEVLADLWKMTPSSSSFRCVLAALRAFGLLDEAASRGETMVKLSERALDILVENHDGGVRRNLAIRAAALTPKLHAEIWGQYSADLPPDIELRRYLVKDLNFNDGKVDRFLQEYKSTLRFAGLIGAGKVDDESAVRDPAERATQGADQSPEPRGIDRIAEDSSDAFREVIMANPPTHQPATGQPPVNGAADAPVSPDLREDVYDTVEGKFVLRFPRAISAGIYEDFEGWLVSARRNVWRSIKDAEGGVPKPPRPV